MEAALDELQRRICRLVLEALLAELQVRLQLEMGVSAENARSESSLQLCF